MKRMIDGAKANELLKLNENIVADGTTTQVGGNLEVDGKITVNSIDDIKAGNAYLQQRLTAGNNIKITENKIEAIIDNNLFEIVLTFDEATEGNLVITGLSNAQFSTVKNGIAKGVSSIVGTEMTWETATAYISNNWTSIATDYRKALFTELFSKCFRAGLQMYWRVFAGATSKIVADYSSVGHVYSISVAGESLDLFTDMINSTALSIVGQKL